MPVQIAVVDRQHQAHFGVPFEGGVLRQKRSFTLRRRCHLIGVRRSRLEILALEQLELGIGGPPAARVGFDILLERAVVVEELLLLAVVGNRRAELSRAHDGEVDERLLLGSVRGHLVVEQFGERVRFHAEGEERLAPRLGRAGRGLLLHAFHLLQRVVEPR